MYYGGDSVVAAAADACLCSAFAGYYTMYAVCIRRVSNKKALEVYKKYGYVQNMFSAYGYSIECILFRIM